MKITDKAVLVKLGISMPGNTRKDPAITKEVKAKHNLGDKSGRWLKQLYPDEALDPLGSLAGEARNWHYEHSLPWSDEGLRILPTCHHFEYTSKMRAYRQQFEELAETHFIGRLPEWIAWAKEQHNGTFDPKLYLSAEQLRRKFAFTTEFTPIPSGEDFRVQLSAEEMADMTTQVDNRVAAAVKEAHRALWARLVTPVAAMVERLSNPDHKFKDSLVGNIRDIVGLIPALNLTGDAALESFRQQVERDLSHWNPDTLREVTTTRKEVADKAAEILAKMQGYYTPEA